MKKLKTRVPQLKTPEVRLQNREQEEQPKVEPATRNKTELFPSSQGVKCPYCDTYSTQFKGHCEGAERRQCRKCSKCYRVSKGQNPQDKGQN
jgi:hypothetical protein